MIIYVKVISRLLIVLYKTCSPDMPCIWRCQSKIFLFYANDSSKLHLFSSVSVDVVNKWSVYHQISSLFNLVQIKMQDNIFGTIRIHPFILPTFIWRTSINKIYTRNSFIKHTHTQCTYIYNIYTHTHAH